MSEEVERMISRELKKTACTLLVLDGLWWIGTLLLGGPVPPTLLGLGLGFIVTLLLLALLGTVVKETLSRPAKSALWHWQFHYAARYLLLAIVLTAAFCSKNINPWCVCLSLLAPKLTYTVEGLWGWLAQRRRTALVEKK